MTLDRRMFFLSAAALGIPSTIAEAIAFTQEPDSSEPFDRETFEFWTKKVRQPSQVFEQTGHLPLTPKGGTKGGPLPSDVDFLYFDRDNGFQVATDSAFGETGLVGKGDVTLSMSVDTIRPSGPHREILHKSGTGSIRVDLKQGLPMRLLSETLNWSAIGSFQGKNAEAIHDLKFDPKSTWGVSKQVPLASGVGFWAWNFSVQKGASKWTQMLQQLGGFSGGMGKPSGKGKSAPDSAAASSSSQSSTSGLGLTSLATAAFSVVGIGLPAIAKTALNTIDQVYGFMHSQGGPKPEPVFQMDDAPVLATQEARQAHHFRAVSLKPGTYLVVSASARAEVMSGKYTLMDYGLVPTGTKEADARSAADNVLPNDSYCIVSVDVATPAAG